MSDFCPLTALPCPHQKCYHVTDIGPNYTAEKDMHLCMICGPNFVANKPPPVFPSVLDLLVFVANQKMQQQMPQKPPCPQCGWTLAAIAHHSRLGCPGCYNHFRQELLTIFQKIHGSTQHHGKRPKQQDEEISLRKLEKQLAEAVAAERYEDAAELKKLIDKKKEPPAAGGSSPLN